MNKCEVTNVSTIPYPGYGVVIILDSGKGKVYYVSNYHRFSIMHMSIICEDDVWSIRKATSMDLLQARVLHSLIPLQNGLQGGYIHTCSKLQLQ